MSYRLNRLQALDMGKGIGSRLAGVLGIASPRARILEDAHTRVSDVHYFSEQLACVATEYTSMCISVFLSFHNLMLKFTLRRFQRLISPLHTYLVHSQAIAKVSRITMAPMSGATPVEAYI
jgi:hypothetical protein